MDAPLHALEAREASSTSCYVITLPSRIIVSFRVLGGLDFDMLLSVTSQIASSEKLVEALVSDHLQDKHDDEEEHDD